MTPKVRAFLTDAAERVGSTAAQAFLATFGVRGLLAVAGGDWNTVTTLARAGEVAALAAALAAVKALLAASKKNTVSPASLAPAQQPGQAEQDAPPPVDSHVDHLPLLPPPSGRKGGALPSPLDARDYRAKLPAKIPSHVDYAAGMTFGMLLNDRIGDCYPAALLHALQVLTGGAYTPSDADVLYVYEQVTGYDPTRENRADGSNPTDQGTYGRQLFAWAKAHGLITSYAAVPVDRTSIRAAIAAHKAVLCEWALPVGAEREGDVWTMPRSGRAAGSWGGHATCEAGYTTERNKNITWGEVGTVTTAFETAYLQAAWVVTAPDVVPPIR